MSSRFIDHVAGVLSALGVTRTYGRWSVPGIAHCEVADSDVAVLLADADGYRRGRWGAATLDHGLIHLSGRPGGVAQPVELRTIDDLHHQADAAAGLDRSSWAGATVAWAGVDLDRPVEAAERWTPPVVPVTGVQLGAGVRAPILAGRGVATFDAAADVRRLAETLGVPIYNTFDAKGLWAWDDPFHGGTVGLQERDLELADIGRGLAVITIGIDVQSVGDLLDDCVAIDIHPRAVPFAVTAAAPGTAPDRPFFERMASVVGPLYDAEPVTPAGAARTLAATRPAGGVVVPTPGWAGFWAARCVPTAEPGSCVTSAGDVPGIAAALALTARLDGHPAVAVAGPTLDPATLHVIEAGRQLRVGLAVQCWDPDGEPSGRADVEALCQQQWRHASDEPMVATVAVDASGERELVDLAGPVVAWAPRN